MIYMNEISKARGTASSHVVNTTILPCLLPHLQVCFIQFILCFKMLFFSCYLTDAESIQIKYICFLGERQINSITCTMKNLHVISQNEIYLPKNLFLSLSSLFVRRKFCSFFSSQFLLFFRLIYIVH